MPLPRSGEVLQIDERASVQFKANPFLFRVIRIHDWPTYEGWVWVDGYELNDGGDAIERRSIWIRWAKVPVVATAPQIRQRNSRRYTPSRPASAPAQRMGLDANGSPTRRGQGHLHGVRTH